MANRTGSTTLALKKLILETRKLGKKEKSKLWIRISNELEKPSRKRREVSIETINRTVKEGETAIVPGKVLSQGELTKKTTVAAYKFSDMSKTKINSKGKAITITQLMKDNPKGKNVRIFG